jgi:hypothetical protein
VPLPDEPRQLLEVLELIASASTVNENFGAATGVHSCDDGAGWLDRR